MSEIDMMGMSFSEARHMVENSISYKIALKRDGFGSSTAQAATEMVMSLMSDMQEEVARDMLTPEDIRQRLNLFKFILSSYSL